MHDLTLKKKTGEPMIKYGLGGRYECTIFFLMCHVLNRNEKKKYRSSTNGQIATVFGCTGFLGRYVVLKLGK